MLQLIDISFNASPPSFFVLISPSADPPTPLSFISLPCCLVALLSAAGSTSGFLFLRACGLVVCEVVVTPHFSFFTITARPNIFLNQTQVGVKGGHLAKTSWPPSLSSCLHTQQIPLKLDNRELFTYFPQLNTSETIPQMYIKKHKP